jgi:hypothetical protein
LRSKLAISTCQFSLPVRIQRHQVVVRVRTATNHSRWRRLGWRCAYRHGFPKSATARPSRASMAHVIGWSRRSPPPTSRWFPAGGESEMPCPRRPRWRLLTPPVARTRPASVRHSVAIDLRQWLKRARSSRPNKWASHRPAVAAAWRRTRGCRAASGPGVRANEQEPRQSWALAWCSFQCRQVGGDVVHVVIRELVTGCDARPWGRLPRWR